MLLSSVTCSPSRSPPGSSPTAPDGAILTRLDDYIESQGHGLYLMNGRVRLHLTHRFTDLGCAWKPLSPSSLNQWQHVLVTYDGKRLAAGRPHLRGRRARETKILFDQNTEPFHKKDTPSACGDGGGMKFDGNPRCPHLQARAYPRGSRGLSLPRTHRERSPPSRRPTHESTAGSSTLAFLDTAAPR